MRPVPPERRGACPALSRPMETGDGLLARLVPADGVLSPGQLAGLSAAARACGNGLVEVTARGSLQLRGLRPETVGPLNDAVAALGIVAREGIAIDLSPLCGLEADALADGRPLAARLRAGLAGVAGRLGPKVSVVVDGGGAIGLDGLSADVRLRAVPADGSVAWELALAGDRAGARVLGLLEAAAAVAAALHWLVRLAGLGPRARMADLLEGAAADGGPREGSRGEGDGGDSLAPVEAGAPLLLAAAKRDGVSEMAAAGLAGQGAQSCAPAASSRASALRGAAAGPLAPCPLPSPPPQAGEGAGARPVPAFLAQAPDQERPDHKTPGHERLGHERLGQALPGHASPSQASPGQASPSHVSPGHLSPGHVSLDHVSLGHVSLGHLSLGHVSLDHMLSDSVPLDPLSPDRAASDPGSPGQAAAGGKATGQAAPGDVPLSSSVAPATPTGPARSPLPLAGEGWEGVGAEGAGAEAAGTEPPGESAPGQGGAPEAEAGAPPPRHPAAPSAPIGLFPLGDGTYALGVALPFGQMEAEALAAFADAAAQDGARDLRPAPGRALLATGLAAPAAQRLAAAARALGFLVAPDDPRARLAACPGAPACRSAHMPARAIAERVAEALAPLLDGSMSVHLSACAKGCAHPAPAPLTLVGMDEGVGLVREASAGHGPEAVLAPDALLPALRALARQVAASRRPGETARAALARAILPPGAATGPKKEEDAGAQSVMTLGPRDPLPPRAGGERP